MSWEDQGREPNGQFGHGTTPENNSNNALFAAGNADARIDAVAHAAVANMPALVRYHANASFDQQGLTRLHTAMRAWVAARASGQTAISDHFFDPMTPSRAIDQLGAAAEGALNARSQQDLARASASLAAAMQTIGLDKWPGFLRDAARRAAEQPVADAEDPAVSPALALFREHFATATAAAWQQFSRDCSHYLQTFLIGMGFADTPYLTANEFMEFVQKSNSGWKPVSAEEAVRLSAKGNIVVAGLAEPGGHGHVAVVGPRMLERGPGRSASPQVFSGASSSWPGTRSQGEYSVADGWSRQDMVNVTYWVKK
jgi:hypothetical protein